MSDRPLIVGADAGPEAPYPLKMEGKVISGFGRGSKELGIPTANLPVDASQTPWIDSVSSGVYFGYASLLVDPSSSSSSSEVVPLSPNPNPDTAATAPSVFPMVMSIGYNPFYRNKVRSAEVHVLRRFARDFYGARVRLLVVGFVRPERDYDGRDALVADIRRDCDVAHRSLARSAWAVGEVDRDGWLTGPMVD